MVTKSQELCITICQTWKLVKEVEQHVATENVVTYAGQLDFEFKTWSPKNDHLNASYALISPLGYMFIYWGNISAK